MQESAENAIEDQVQDLRLSLVVSIYNRQSNHPKIRSLQVYFTLHSIKLMLPWYAKLASFKQSF